MDSEKRGSIYKSLLLSIESVFEGEANWIANCANLSSLLFHGLNETAASSGSASVPAPFINWLGFYLVDARCPSDLILGPFQGKVACVRIPLGRGVCGTAAAKRQTLIVPNVHDFPGHIACDAASNSEIVVPFYGPSGILLGVLDIDSCLFNAFASVDAQFLSDALARLVACSDFSDLVDRLPGPAENTLPGE